MTIGHVFIATSLDGFVAREDRSLDWLMKQNTGDEDQGYSDFIASVDGLVMGRGSYQTVLTFDKWPYEIPVVVMSSTLTQKDIPNDLTDKVRITALEPRELMKSLKSEGWKHAYVDGGKVVRSFIKAGLIEDIIITTIPILIGDGIRLFGELDSDIDLTLLESRSFQSGLVQNHYRLAQDKA